MVATALAERRLAVILHADVAGSTTLVQRDESLAHQRMTSAFRNFGYTIRSYRGQVHEIRGDALVAEFSRASDAISAALAFQELNGTQNQTFTDDIVPILRVGVSLGEVVIADNTVTGPGVVLAQRVEQLAKPGGVAVTAAICEAAPGRLPFDYMDLGPQSAKGFDEPVHVFAIGVKSGSHIPPPERVPGSGGRATQSLGRGLIWISAGLITVAIALAVAWLSPWGSDVKPVRAAKMTMALPDRPSIAVIPFENVGGDETQADLVDGFTGTLISSLASAPRLFVIAQESTRRYKGKQIEPRVVAEEQGVRYVLVGTVQWSGKRMRVAVQLVDALKGAYIWSERYDRDSKAIFEVQDDMAKNILAGVEGELIWAHGPNIWARMTDNLDAYLHYLKGQKALFRFSPDNNQIAREHAKKAIELDPSFASGWNLLGWTYHHEAHRGWGSRPREELWSTARQYALRAIELAPTYGSPRGLLATIAFWQRRFDESVSICEEAVTIAPNEAILLATCSGLLNSSGKHQRGVELIGSAMRLSPYPPVWFKWMKGRAHFSIGDYATTIDLFTLDEGDPASNAITESLLAAALHATGRTDEAKERVDRLLATDPKITAHRITNTYPARHEPESRGRLVEALIAAGFPPGTRPPNWDN